MRSRTPEQLSPYEAVLRSFGYFERVTAEELAAARSGLELAVRKAPAYADAWAMLALLCVQEYAQGFKLQADSLASGSTAARRAVEAAPSNHLAHFSLAQALFFHKEFQSFRNAAERAVALNPMDGNSIAFLGELLTYAGDWERGLALAGRAKQLNPNHPGWYWYADFYDAYRQGDYRGALDVALKVNLPGHWGTHAAMAAALRAARGTRCGRESPAGTAQAAAGLRRYRTERHREVVGARVRGALDRRLAQGGAGDRRRGRRCRRGPSPRVRRPASGASRADEGFWVAVLPFKYGGANADLTALADGLSEDIVTGLSRFSYLRVIAQSSTSRYARRVGRRAGRGRELGARYVMEGSLRQAGTKLRIAVQLVDASSGAHLWAETYDRHFQPGSGVRAAGRPGAADRLHRRGRARRSASQHERSDFEASLPMQLSPYEAVLRSFGYGYRISPEEHAVVRAGLERAVEEAPGYADCLGACSRWSTGRSIPRDSTSGPIPSGARSGRRSEPSTPLRPMRLRSTPWPGPTSSARNSRRFAPRPSGRSRSTPWTVTTLAGLGSLMAYAGDWEHGCALVERATHLNPRHPGWYWMALFMNAYRKGDYRGAVGIGLKVNLPDIRRDARVHGGRLRAARGARRGRQKPARAPPTEAGLPRRIRREKLQKFVSIRSSSNTWMDGLRKAGLDVPARAGGDPASAPTDRGRDCRAALLGHERRKGPGVSLRGHGRGDHERARSRPRHPRRVADFGISSSSRTAGDLPAIARALSVGHVLEGSVRTSGTPAARHRAAHRRCERLPALVGAIRPGRRRHLRRPGRDRPGCRRRRQGAISLRETTRFRRGRSPRTSRPTAAI